MATRLRKFINKVLLTIGIGAMVALTVYFISDYFFRQSFKHYKEFGIDLPNKYSIHGIDVSHYQQNILWQDVQQMKVKNVAIGFVFIKGTEGTDRVDDKFRDNMQATKKVGIIRGVYHFFVPSKSGKEQAENFLENVHLKKGDLPPVLDVEQINGTSISDLQQRVADWLTIVEKKYNTKPIIYSNVDFYKTFLADRFADYPLWVAHYLVKDKPRIERKWLFWQHNEQGHVNGIRTNVDFNVFNGDSAEFKNILLQ